MIKSIYIAKEHGGKQTQQQEIDLIRGKGITGDRNFGKDDWPGQNLTLIELEEIEHFRDSLGLDVKPAAMRRNLITQYVRLNKLVGKTFFIGNVELYGVELCEPCAWLGEQLQQGKLKRAEIVKALVGKSGLRADVLSDGKIHIGASIDKN